MKDTEDEMGMKKKVRRTTRNQKQAPGPFWPADTSYVPNGRAEKRRAERAVR